MEYSLSNSLVGGGGGLNLDKLSLDLPFAITKSLTAAKGPTPDFVRASSGTYFGSDGYLKTAGNNVARFDHETSYIGSTVFVQCVDCVDVYSNVFSAAERIPLSGIDGNGYPYFLSSLFSVSYSISTSEWILSYDAGSFEAYSVAGLSDEYIPYGAIGGVVTVTAELACKGLLIEEQSTNLATYSQLLTNVSWVPNAATVSVPGTIGPNAATAFEVAETGANSGHNIFNTGGLTTTPAVSYTSGLLYTLSIFAKKSAGSINWIQLTGTGGPFGAGQHANFNIGAGVVGYSVGTAVGFPPKIESVGNGWYRCSLTLVAIATSTGNAVTVLFTNNTDSTTRGPSYFGNTANKVLLSMAQAEQKAFPTSYIPTTTGSVPRSADLCSITGTKFTGFYNQTEGSFASSVIFNTPIANAAGQLVFDASDGSLSNRFRLARNGTTGFIAAASTSSGTQDVAIVGSTVVSPNTVIKLAACMNTNDFAVYLDGVSQGVDTTAAMPLSLTTLTIGDIFSASATKAPLNGCISSIKYYKKRLTNAKLQSLTAP